MKTKKFNNTLFFCGGNSTTMDLNDCTFFQVRKIKTKKNSF